MEGLAAAVQPFVGPAVFIALMFLMHGLHGGHGGHSGPDASRKQAGTAKRDETVSPGAHQHD